MAHERITGGWMQALSLDAIAARLDAAIGDAHFTHLAMVHHETTTGRLNDLKSLGGTVPSARREYVGRRCQ
jgi:2-aminoethylphosphonate-pyruvate transaminase